jgi:hypothetical protein
MNPRKGLKRHGMRAYIVQGPERAILIERERPSVFRVRPADMPPAFDFGQYRRLGVARQYAEELAAIDNFPDPKMPVCLRRWKP